jgi:hypothetical protein
MKQKGLHRLHRHGADEINMIYREHSLDEPEADMHLHAIQLDL